MEATIINTSLGDSLLCVYGGWGLSEYRTTGPQWARKCCRLHLNSSLLLNSELKYIHAILIASAMSLEEGGRELNMA